MEKNPDPDLVKVKSYATSEQNSLICSQDIEQKDYLDKNQGP